MWVIHPCPSRKISRLVRSLPFCVTVPGLGLLVKLCAFFSYPSRCHLFVLCYGICSSNFQIFSRWKWSICSNRLSMSMEVQNLPAMLSWTTFPYYLLFFFFSINIINYVTPSQKSFMISYYPPLTLKWRTNLAWHSRSFITRFVSNLILFVYVYLLLNWPIKRFLDFCQCFANCFYFHCLK